MNDLVWELFKKSGIDIGEDQEGNIEKFAELIVNECRDVVISNFHECRSVSRLDKIVREHFGVK
jgi:hypothetical protein